MKKKGFFFFLLINICSFIECANVGAGTYFQLSLTPLMKYTKQLEINELQSHFEGVDCIYVINLDERPQKWARVKPLFDERGLKVNRVSGIIGKNLSNEIKRELFGPYFCGIDGVKKSGHIGCFLSHLSIMKDAYERNFEVIWVMEDDVEFIEDIRQIPNLLKNLSLIDPYWDVCYTDVDSKNNKGEYVSSLMLTPRPDQVLQPLDYYLKRTYCNENIMKIGQRFGMYSVFISRRGLKKIMKYFSHVYLWCPIDVDIHYIPRIRQYSFTRDIVSHWAGNDFSDTSCPETSTLK